MTAKTQRIVERGLEALLVACLGALILFMALPQPAHGQARTVVSKLPTCTDGNPGAVFIVDGASSTDCSTGSGSTEVLCCCLDGSWAACASGSGGSGDITDVWACTTGNCNTITGASGDSLDAGSADSISPATRSTSVPGTCTEGFVHQETDAGGVETYTCTASNTYRQHAPYDYDPDEPARGTGVDNREDYIGGTEQLTWSTGNWSTTTSTFSVGTGYFVAPKASGENVRFRGIAAPTGKDYFVVAKLAATHEGLSFNAGGVSLLIGTLATPTRIDICGWQMNSTDFNKVFWGTWSSYTTFGSNLMSPATIGFLGRASPLYAGLFIDYTDGDPGTYTALCYLSFDGVFFWSNVAANSLAAAPDYVGIALNAAAVGEESKLGVFWWEVISGASRLPGAPVFVTGGPL